jgi:hypothetical protein
MKRAAVFTSVIILLVAVVGVAFRKSPWYDAVALRVQGKDTIDSVVARLGVAARVRMRPYFDSAGMAYPPRAVSLLVFKEERMLELWARGDNGYVFMREYPIHGASGGPGPKLREGDMQVPEGVYRICALNPNSAFHLSLKVDYPNAFDRQQAASEGRTNLGGDIFVHGGAASIGCLAMGDEAIEELFILVADVGMQNVEIIIAPRDFRREFEISCDDLPVWVEALYAEIVRALEPCDRRAPRE